MTYSIETTEQFDHWLRKLKDRPARAKILNRLATIEISGHFGDHKNINAEIKELRFFIGSGYRVYYTMRDGQMIILLAGGDKNSQQRDIAKAIQLEGLL